ncbi:MAG: damage-inducible protein DinB [Cytophagaceae bacterium]|jgi:uncharacterized damage-inducible protein DinB|nr:damage-inducible protein DinB [Cytophagaceae bacterium]
MVPFFKELFDYGHHYNRELLKLFLKQPEKTSEKSIQLFNHMLNAHQIWNNRIQPNRPTHGVWQMNELHALEEILEANFNETLAILDSKDLDLNQVITYKTSKGDSFQNTIRDILFHVINHTTYHRAQIATEFKNNGLEPLVSDYIFYKR